MKYHKIDINTWERADVYRHYMEKVPCTYSMCVQLQVGRARARAKERGLRFFPVVLYALSHSLNQFEQFRMGYSKAGELICYERVDPCYTVFHSVQEQFSNSWSTYTPDFDAFYKEYLQDQELYGGEISAGNKPGRGENIFYVSCIPWVAFTSFHLNIKDDYQSLAPMFTIGQYTSRETEMLMPLAVQVHHAVCDGFHTARMVRAVQQWLDDFSCR